MGKHYQHLSAEERAMIKLEHGRGSSLRSIARQLGRDVSTVPRELAGNRAGGTACGRKRCGYDPTVAARAYRDRRLRCVRRRKLVEGSWLHRHVHDRLVYWRWSPQQIASRL
ncbi:MAG: IS30 family transposase, partial [Rhodanobacteraceae bacterium]